MMDRSIYLDYAATTPLDPRVLDAMLPYLSGEGVFANPASSHAPGFAARDAVERARAQVAALIGAEASEIIWTSGATESNNLAIKGALEFRGLRDAHLVTARTEHKCVLDTARYLETLGLRVTYLKPDRRGVIAPEQVIEALTPQTRLVSLMWINNEIGVVQDIETLAPLLRARGVLLHVDAAQAAGRIAIDVRDVPVDLLSLSAHKAYGPKGIGALYVRRRPRARLAPQMHGGGHEQGMRSGTLATHQVVGMGAAFELLAGEDADEAQRVAELRDRLWQRLRDLPGVHANGGDAPRRAPHVLNLSFEGVEGEALRASLPDLAVSSGSACSSATQEPSYVLRALGRDDTLANASLRFSLGRRSTAGEVDAAAAIVRSAVLRLRALAAGEPVEALEGLSNVFGYSAPVWQGFCRGQAAGFDPQLDRVLSSESGTPATRAWLRLQVQVVGEHIAEARFQAFACPTGIAVGAWLAAWCIGKTLVDLRGLNAAELRRALEIPEDRAHCALMGEDAVRALIPHLEGIT